jgi:hypothetical protein
VLGRLGGEHINLTGNYQWKGTKLAQGKFRLSVLQPILNVLHRPFSEATSDKSNHEKPQTHRPAVRSGPLYGAHALPSGKARLAKFDRILDKAPPTFSAAQLRVFLRALVNIAASPMT